MSKANTHLCSECLLTDLNITNNNTQTLHWFPAFLQQHRLLPQPLLQLQVVMVDDACTAAIGDGSGGGVGGSLGHDGISTDTGDRVT